MRLISILLAFFTIHLAACAKEKRKDHTPGRKDPLVSAKQGIELWAEKCEGGAAKKDCGDGDSTLWNGLLCASGEAFACDAVVASQDESGRVWRSPRLKGTDPKNTFSRDMGMGTLAFLAKTKNKDFGEKWTAFINSNKGLCESENNNCGVTSTFFWAYNNVAEHVGFSKLKTSVIFGFADTSVDDLALVVQANNTPSGYQTHLVGVHVYLRLLEGKWNDPLQVAADVLHKREPNNIFFEYLSKGKSQALADKLVNRLPFGPNDDRDQWCWERTDSENACQDSMGWDFIFAINLMLN